MSRGPVDMSREVSRIVGAVGILVGLALASTGEIRGLKTRGNGTHMS